jgi:hypothetical protein
VHGGDGRKAAGRSGHAGGDGGVGRFALLCGYPIRGNSSNSGASKSDNEIRQGAGHEQTLD